MNFFTDGIHERKSSNRHNRTYRGFRKAVLNRNKNKCAKCSSFQDLQIHHILNYATHEELRLCLDNAIPLCSECHLKFHEHYGYEENDENQLKEFLGKKQYRRFRSHANKSTHHTSIMAIID